MSNLALRIDGQVHNCPAEPGETLLQVLRDRLGLKYTKMGCGRGECGSCTVLVNGRAVLACMTLADPLDGPVETAAGLARESRALRGAFADQGAFQCSFCTSGMVVQCVSLLRKGLPPSDAELRRQLSGNLCRCTGYQAIVEALRQTEKHLGKPMKC